MARHSASVILISALSLILLAACTTTGSRDSSGYKQTKGEARLIDELREGGYVIFIRHASADNSPFDNSRKIPRDCGTTRVLGGLGRSQSKVIGKSFKKLKIPVGEVITGLHCQSVNTAKLAFGKATPSQKMGMIASKDLKVRRKGVKALNRMLGRVPARGINSVIVAPDYLLDKTSGVALKAGEAAIYKPRGDGTVKLVKRISPSGWQRLAAGY